jgi:bacterioferritin-associated ferredoxin
MYACLCFGITERVVREHVREGARSLEEVGRVCRAGTDCGGCLAKIERLIVEEERETGKARSRARST